MSKKPRQSASNLFQIEIQAVAPKTFDAEWILIPQSGRQSAKSKDSLKNIDVPAHYADLFKLLRSRAEFVGGYQQIHWQRLATKGSDLVLIGVGKGPELNLERMRRLGGALGARALAEKRGSWFCDLDLMFSTLREDAELSEEKVAAFLEGFALACYRFSKYRSHIDSSPKIRIHLATTHSTRRDRLTKLVGEIMATQEAVFKVRDWSNEPSNVGTPEFYAKEAKAWAGKKGLKFKVLAKAELTREKMGMLLSVSQGSQREPRVVIVEYSPKKSSRAPKAKTLVLVGKGVTFDSGGISIKPALRMEDMKHDMTGAATVLGAVGLAADLKSHNRVVGILGFVENMPDGGAVQPGNILYSRSGKTVEMVNTDAEGRLVLGDLLDLAMDFKPDAVVDVATLTGAVGIALGKMACAVLGNDDGLVKRLQESGDVVGERSWQLPLWDEYLEDLRSDIGDLKNSANDGGGGTIRAAIFLKQFIKSGVSWAHLDIASTAYSVPHLSYCPRKGASGLFVRTLAQLARDL